MINTVVLVGRLTRDLDLRKTQNGKSVLSFSLAVRRRFQQNGQPDADFINCVAWGRTAEVMAQYLRKGSQIGVEGRLQTRSYDNQQGQRVYVTEVVVDNFSFLESRQQDNQGSYGSYQGQSNSGYQGGYSQNSYGNNSGYQNSGNYGGYGNQSGFGSNNTYGQPVQGSNAYGNGSESNPYSSSMNSPLNDAFDNDDDPFDIDSDDLPF